MVFWEKDTTDSQKAHFITLENRVHGVFIEHTTIQKFCGLLIKNTKVTKVLRCFNGEHHDFGNQWYFKGAFDEFIIRWLPPVPLVYPQPAGFFPWRVRWRGKTKRVGSASIDASRLIFQSAVSSQIRLVAKRQAGPNCSFLCTPAVKLLQ